MSFSIFETGDKYIFCSEKQIFFCKNNNQLIFHYGNQKTRNLLIKLIFFFLNKFKVPIEKATEEPKVFHVYKIYRTINHKIIFKYKTFAYIDESFGQSFWQTYNIIQS